MPRSSLKAESKKGLTKGQRTRAALLDSAGQAFSQKGYDGAGLREIADAASVNVALIKLYFGSKEALFREVVHEALDGGELMLGDIGELARRWAHFTIAGVSQERPRLEASNRALQILMRSAASRVAVATVREAINDKIVARIAARLEGPHALERAALISTYLLGTALMQRIIGVTPLVDGDQDQLIAQLTNAVQVSLDPPSPPARTSRRKTRNASS